MLGRLAKLNAALSWIANQSRMHAAGSAPVLSRSKDLTVTSFSSNRGIHQQLKNHCPFSLPLFTVATALLFFTRPFTPLAAASLHLASLLELQGWVPDAAHSPFIVSPVPVAIALSTTCLCRLRLSHPPFRLLRRSARCRGASRSSACRRLCCYLLHHCPQGVNELADVRCGVVKRCRRYPHGVGLR